jgi:hypothetical protein
MLFGSQEKTPGPVSLGAVDWRTGSGETEINYGAYVFLVVAGQQEVRKFISSEQYIFINQDLPPENF